MMSSDSHVINLSKFQQDAIDYSFLTQISEKSFSISSVFAFLPNGRFVKYHLQLFASIVIT
jgi:hypothetical protein